MKNRKITEKESRVAVDILEEIIIANVPVPEGWYDKIMERYNLTTDPFTGLPCTWNEYIKSHKEYERQTMIERYGHSDGLED